jgi:L-asparaginase II
MGSHMANPVIAEVSRGTRVESVHRGAWAVVDADGRTLAAEGDVETPVFARSALKLMQALPLVESGAAAAFALDVRQLALAGASHSGEPGHVETARAMLAAAGLEEADLGCGPHWPRDVLQAVAVAERQGRPGRLHNNCSGKHAGFLCTCRHLGQPTRGYLDGQHPLQREIRGIIAALTGTALAGDLCSVDGCSAPTYAVPLAAFAGAFARLATGAGLAAERAAAARALIGAAMAEPWFVAGSGRTCTELMLLEGGRVYAKTGAEGVFIAALPREGLGFAMKCDDGAARAVEVLLAALLARYAEGGLSAALARHATAPVRDFNGAQVGEVRAVLSRSS